MKTAKNIRLYIFSILVTSFVLVAFVPEVDVNTEPSITTQIDNESAVVVEMTNTMKFTPDTVTIKTGQTVEWENNSLLAHSVTGDPSQSTIEGSTQLPVGAQAFDSGMMDPEQTFTHTFKVPGTYQYFCIPHEGAEMYGWVIVLDD